MITSVNRLSAELEAIQEAHYQLNSFYFGEFNLALQKRDLEYPLLICDYNSGAINISNTSIQLFVTICDKVYKDNSNLLETKSDTLQICRDVFNIMKKSQRWNEIGRVTQGNVNAFVERGKDEVAGHVMNVTIELRDSNGTYSHSVASGDTFTLPNMDFEVYVGGIYKELVTLITLDN